MPPALALSLVERLPEGSKTSSMMQDPEHYRAYLDIGPEYYVLAGIYDSVNTNTVATGMFKKRPKVDPWPTPSAVAKKQAQASRPKTVKDLFNSLQQRG